MLFVYNQVRLFFAPGAEQSPGAGMAEVGKGYSVIGIKHCTEYRFALVGSIGNSTAIPVKPDEQTLRFMIVFKGDGSYGERTSGRRGSKMTCRVVHITTFVTMS